ncbi:unnamed protein product [Paramecium sonneborni]|uniref:Copine n=1 Tax=Paramecium sonneborni TaxID=65129 RepID=A0A8S1M2G3_9CILI|nr:unnamed protein product [Paramecium sonneborni]
MDNCYQQIEIFISGRQLKDLDYFSKSDPFVIVFIKNNNQWIKIGRTETIDNNLNPNFKKSFQLDYVFEVVQPIKFEVRDDDGDTSELIGQIETTIGALFGAKNQTSILELGKQRGKLIIRCDKIQEGNEFMIMKWTGVKLMNTDGWFDKSDPFLKFYRQRDDLTYIQTHETEVIMDNLNPLWKLFEIQSVKLAQSNDKKIKIECWDWEKSGKNQFIGELIITIQDLQQNKEYQLTNPKHKNPGRLRLDQFSTYIRPSFQDYIRGGLQLNLMAAIDFTGSNGAPHQPGSLHFRSPHQLNQYQIAINAVGEILLAYDYDKMVPCYGFGANLNYPTMRSGQVSHCFPLSGDPNQINAYELQGIANLYNYALANVTFSGPTYFGPIIQEALRQIYQQQQTEQNAYTILLILTDGIIHDMEQTKQLIVNSSRVPLSIIIVGVGNENFQMMEELDGDQGLYSGNRKAERDLVQFVPFRNFSGNHINLARHVLAEIPEQIVKYHQLIGKKPNPPQFIDINQLGMTQPNLQNLQPESQPPQIPNNVYPQIQQPNVQPPFQQPMQSQIPYQQQIPPYVQQQSLAQQPPSQYQPYPYPQNNNYQQPVQQSQQQTRASEQINPSNFMYQQYGQLPQNNRQSCNLQQVPYSQLPPNQQNNSQIPNHQYPPISQSQQKFGQIKNPME